MINHDFFWESIDNIKDYDIKIAYIKDLYKNVFTKCLHNIYEKNNPIDPITGKIIERKNIDDSFGGPFCHDKANNFFNKEFENSVIYKTITENIRDNSTLSPENKKILMSEAIMTQMLKSINIHLETIDLDKKDKMDLLKNIKNIFSSGYNIFNIILNVVKLIIKTIYNTPKYISESFKSIKKGIENTIENVYNTTNTILYIVAYYGSMILIGTLLVYPDIIGILFHYAVNFFSKIVSSGQVIQMIPIN